MKFPLRFVWYVLRIVIVAAAAFAVLAVAFFIAMDSAHVYVIVTDGMKAKATGVLIPAQSTDLTRYFTEPYLNRNKGQVSPYVDYGVTDFNYKLDVESLWCNPWNNTATVTVVESVKDIVSTGSADPAQPQPPKWPRARYKISCVRQGDAWRIDAVDVIKNLPAEPTASPEPSNYITASPVPTATPKPSVTPSASPTATPTATK